MQRALCNASAQIEPQKIQEAKHCPAHGSMHICSLEHGHKTNVHICSCGAIFKRVKQSEINRAGRKLEKVQ